MARTAQPGSTPQWTRWPPCCRTPGGTPSPAPTTASPRTPWPRCSANSCVPPLEHPERDAEQGGGEHQEDAGLDTLEGPEPVGRLVGEVPPVAVRRHAGRRVLQGLGAYGRDRCAVEDVATGAGRGLAVRADDALADVQVGTRGLVEPREFVVHGDRGHVMQPEP